MAVKFGLVAGGRPTIIAINRIMLLHRTIIQQSIAVALTRTRARAADYIIENTTNFVNPYLARKYQPSTPGRLTSRTGKLKFMLSHYTAMNNPLAHWKGFGKTLVKERSVALMGQIRAQRLTRTTEMYIGTYRVNITSHPRLWDTARKRPVETAKTLAVRFQWEHGIRGQQRPIFAPVVRLADFDMRNWMQAKDKALRGMNI